MKPPVTLPGDTPPSNLFTILLWSQWRNLTLCAIYVSINCVQLIGIFLRIFQKRWVGFFGVSSIQFDICNDPIFIATDYSNFDRWSPKYGRDSFDALSCYHLFIHDHGSWKKHIPPSSYTTKEFKTFLKSLTPNTFLSLQIPRGLQWFKYWMIHSLKRAQVDNEKIILNSPFRY